MKGIIYNQDADSLLYGIGRYDCTLTADEMRSYASQFIGSHMTDIMLALCNTCASYPSKVVTDLVQKYHQKFDNGIEVDYTENFITKAAHHVFETLGIDHIAIEIDTFRSIGINPWISFRMNDFHDHHCEASPILPEYFHKHPEIRRAGYKPSDINGNGDKCKDYSLPFVREMMLALINEALERYDPYGVELDFQREICVFADGNEHDGIEIMNEFIRQIYSLCQKYGEKYGHKIKLGVRVAPKVEQNYDYGLNVMQWVQEGLIDLVTICGRFESNDNDMPVKLWKTLLSPYGVELAAGIEMNILPRWGIQPICPSLETFAACAASAYSQGADKIYMYNYFHNFQAPHINTVDPSFAPDANGVNREAAFYSTFGDFDKVLKLNRRHIITVNDRLPPWERNRAYAQLPITFDRARDFKITVGKIPENARTIVHIGFGDSTERVLENPPTVFVNGEKATYLGAESDERYARETVLSFEVPKTAYRSNAFILIHAHDKTIEAKERTTVDYIDVHITID